MPMYMELHDDSKVGNSLFANIGKPEDPVIDYDYQAEEWIKETVDNPNVIKWILFDDQGERCVWERKSGDTRLPIITKKSNRYQGEYCVTHDD